MNELNEFLLTTGRTLSQMALYSPEHPLVKGAVDESHRLLLAVLADNAEVSITVNEGKLIVNGVVPEGVPMGSIKPFLQLLNAFDLHSLTFLRGITPAEMIPFFRLASRTEKKSSLNVNDYLAQNEMEHVKVNLARYAKIAEDQTIGGREEADDIGAPGGSMYELLKDLSLYDMMQKLINKAVNDPADRAKILKRALDLVKEQIDQAVQKVVTDFNRERTRLVNERERTEQVLGNMAEGVVVVDEDGKVVMMNPAAEQLYGVKLGECLGKPLWEGVREEHLVALAKDLTVPSDRPLTKEVQLQGTPEVKKTLRASAATIQDPEGRIVGMVSVLSDVTKQKELNRLQNEFMANVTHDLRAPIHALKLAITAILEGAAGTVSGEQTKMLTLAGRNVDRLSRLIDDLLDFSKIESGKIDIKPQILDVDSLLSEATASMDSWAKNRGITLVYEGKKDLLAVYADGDRILQVVNNLVSNAIKFTPRGGRVTLRAKNWLESETRAVRIEVEDTGAGISKEDQKRIFERFVQLRHEEKLDIRGTGLGLSICKALVTLHRGDLGVQSPGPSGKGSIFHFTLPAIERGTTIAAPVIQAPVPAPPPRSERRGFWKRLFGRSRLVPLILLAGVSLASARPYWGTVRRIVSADTIQLKDGTLVRFLGIRAPDKGTSAYVEAVAAGRQWIENREVRLQYGLQERDNEGVWNAYVFVDGVLMNAELVRNGLALVARLSNEEKFLPELVEAEREARRESRGLWKESVLDSYPMRLKKENMETEEGSAP